MTPAVTLSRLVSRWLASWWCAPVPTVSRSIPPLPRYAGSCSPHPLKDVVVWVDEADEDDAWAVVAGGIV